MQLTTDHLLVEANAHGYPTTPKQLTDMAQRGLIGPSKRVPRRGGGRGSEGVWPDDTIEKLIAIREMQKEGMSYDDIAEKLLGVNQMQSSRRNVTIWLGASQSRRADKVYRESKVPFVQQLQLGADLYYQAPGAIRSAMAEKSELARSFSREQKARGSDLLFSKWLDFGLAYYDLLRAIETNETIDQTWNPDLDAYFLWRLISNGDLSDPLLQALHIERRDLMDGDEVVGTIVRFSKAGTVIEMPDPPARDIEWYRERAAEMGAILAGSPQGHFDTVRAANTLGQIADWIREEQNRATQEK